MSVFELISLARDIYTVCQDVAATKKVVKTSGEKLLALTPLLETLEQQQQQQQVGTSSSSGGGGGGGGTQGIVTSLEHDLRNVNKIILKAQKMNRILYVIKASSIHDDLEGIFQHIQFTLGALSVRQNVTLQSTLTRFQTEWERIQNQENSDIRPEQQQQRQQLLTQVSSSSLTGGGGQDNTSNIVASSTSAEELKDAQKALIEEQEEIQKILLESHDSIQNLKLLQEEALLGQIITALATAEEHILVAAVEGYELQQEQDDRSSIRIGIQWEQEDTTTQQQQKELENELLMKQQHEKQMQELQQQHALELQRLQEELLEKQKQQTEELDRREEELKQREEQLQRKQQRDHNHDNDNDNAPTEERTSSYSQVAKKDLPEWALCPVTSEVMLDPVTVDANCLHNVSRVALQEWIQRGNTTCPFCSSKLRSSENLSPNVQLRDAIEQAIHQTEVDTLRSEVAARALAAIRASSPSSSNSRQQPPPLPKPISTTTDSSEKKPPQATSLLPPVVVDHNGDNNDEELGLKEDIVKDEEDHSGGPFVKNSSGEANVSKSQNGIQEDLVQQQQQTCPVYGIEQDIDTTTSPRAGGGNRNCIVDTVGACGEQLEDHEELGFQKHDAIAKDEVRYYRSAPSGVPTTLSSSSTTATTRSISCGRRSRSQCSVYLLMFYFFILGAVGFIAFLVWFVVS